jgi:hypothetical protein
MDQDERIQSMGREEKGEQISTRCTPRYCTVRSAERQKKRANNSFPKTDAAGSS